MSYTKEIAEVLGPKLEPLSTSKTSKSTKIPHYGRRQARKISKHQYIDNPSPREIGISFLIIVVVFIFLLFMIYYFTKSKGFLEIPILVLGIVSVIIGWIFYNVNKYHDHILALVVLTLFVLLIFLLGHNILEFKHYLPLALIVTIGFILVETYITKPTKGCWYFSLIVIISVIMSSIKFNDKKCRYKIYSS